MDEVDLRGGCECPVCGCWVQASDEVDDDWHVIRYECRCGWTLEDVVVGCDEDD